MIAAPALRERPLVITSHGLHRLRRSRGAKAWLVQRRLRVAIEASARTICIAGAERDDLAAVLPPSLHQRLVVVANGVPLPAPTDSERRARARQSLGLGDDEVAALYVGRLEERKDPLGAVSAVEAARARGADVVLLIAGSGPLEGEVFASQSAGVRPLGHRDDLEDLHAAADIFVLPSHREGMSFALLEAMAHGLVPVVSDGPGHAETVGSAGVVFPAGDLPALSERLVALAADPAARAQRGAAARERVATKLSLESFLAGTRAQYEAALRSGRLTAAAAKRSFDPGGQDVGQRRAQKPTRSPQGSSASQRADSDRESLGSLSALGASGDVAAAHHPRAELLVKRHYTVALDDPQPEVVLGGEAIARVVSAQLQRHVAPEGGGAVGNRVEAHQRRADVACGKRGPRPQLPVVAVDLAHPSAHHRDGGVGAENGQLPLQALGHRVVVGVLDRHDGSGGRPQPLVKRSRDALVPLQSQDPAPRVGADRLLRHCSRAVAGPVVDHDQLQGLLGLTQDRRDRTGHRALVVIGADEHRDGGRVGDHRLRELARSAPLTQALLPLPAGPPLRWCL